MLAISAASGLPAEITLGFVDAEVNRLLDLDTQREVSLCIVPVGRTSENSSPTPREFPPLGFATIPVSQRQVEYPAMLEMHEASSLASGEEVARWRERGRQQIFSSSAPAGEEVRLQPLRENEEPSDTIEEVILRRGSTRTFDASASITLAQLSTILDRATRGLTADFLQPGAQLNDIYLIAHSVDGLAPGAYLCRRKQRTLELIKPGKFRAEAYRLGLEQQLPADACVDVFFLADLNRVLDAYGNRGYRAVQLEAGAIGGKMYLAAYALRLGASGLTFFDDEVVQFFSLHAKEKSAIFLLAIGKPLKRKAD
jgi:SagB-type dehydrogenase family enzyme